MRGSLRRNMLDCPITEGAKVQAAEAALHPGLARPEQGRGNFIDVPGLNYCLTGLDATTDLDVLLHLPLRAPFSARFDAVETE